jgi:hypothetical protein
MQILLEHDKNISVEVRTRIKKLSGLEHIAELRK